MINKFMKWLSNDIGLPWFIVIIIIIVIFILSIVLFQNIYNKLNDYMTNSRFKKQWETFNAIAMLVICISLLTIIIVSNIKSCMRNVDSDKYEEPYIRGHGH